jgi:hypothetical protein
MDGVMHVFEASSAENRKNTAPPSQNILDLKAEYKQVSDSNKGRMLLAEGMIFAKAHRPKQMWIYFLPAGEEDIGKDEE